MQIDDARAILLAEQEDEQAEKEAQAAYEEEQARLRLREEMEAKKEAEANMKEIKVDANFDPTQTAAGAGGMSAASAGLGLGMGGASANTSTKPDGMPGPAKKEDVVFDITTDQIQEIIMESPVPVLLDVYAGERFLISFIIIWTRSLDHSMLILLASTFFFTPLPPMKYVYIAHRLVWALQGSCTGTRANGSQGGRYVPIGEAQQRQRAQCIAGSRGQGPPNR